MQHDPHPNDPHPACKMGSVAVNPSAPSASRPGDDSRARRRPAGDTGSDTAGDIAGPTGNLGYQPALDGLRAVAVVMVLAFHLALPGADGGYLGVSVFFTLSGFLITRLLLDEFDRTGTIGLRRFYRRRIRRLLPASFLVVALVVVLAAFDAFSASSRIRGGTVAALTSTFNWYELLGGRDYADLFRAPSPLAHFWSLAIEEQFYWLWPLVLLAILPRVAARRRFAVIGTMALAASISAPVTAAAWSSAAAYFTTWTRSAEILVGAALATWTARSTMPAWVGRLAWPSLAAVLVVGAITPAGRGWAYGGGLPLFALLSVVLIAALQAPPERSLGAASLLSARPVVWVGTVSYGIYLFHWPVIVWLTEDRTGLGRWWLVALQVAVTMVATVASFVLLERPVRAGRVSPSRLAGGFAVVAAATVLVAFTLTPQAAPALPDAPGVIVAAPASTSPATLPAPDDAPTATAPVDTRADVATPAPTTTTPATTTLATTTTLPRMTSIAIFGDSVPAWLLRDAAPTFDRTDVAIANGAIPACDGMVDMPAGRDRRGDEMRVPDDCVDWTVGHPRTFAAAPQPVDVAVLVLGQVPMADRFVDGEWRNPCDGIDWYLDDIDARVEDLRSRGAVPVVAIPAPPGSGSNFFYPGDVDARSVCVRDQMTTWADANGVAAIDLGDALCTGGDCERLRTVDGVHVDPEFAPEVLDRLLDETIAAAGLR